MLHTTLPRLETLLHSRDRCARPDSFALHTRHFDRDDLVIRARPESHAVNSAFAREVVDPSQNGGRWTDERANGRTNAAATTTT